MYKVVVPASVIKQLKKVPGKTRDRVLDEIGQLGADPRPPNCIKLIGEDLYRIRVGDYRVIYAVDDATHQVIVARIGHRREVYR